MEALGAHDCHVTDNHDAIQVLFLFGIFHRKIHGYQRIIYVRKHFLIPGVVEKVSLMGTSEGNRDFLEKDTHF